MTNEVKNYIQCLRHSLQSNHDPVYILTIIGCIITFINVSRN